jgi:(4-O-methyl)-D-glucuronate---lignin esterase
MNRFRAGRILTLPISFFLGWGAATLAAQNAAPQAAPAPAAVVFHAGRPQPAPPGDVRDFETLTTPPAGFRMQRRNNFYKLSDPASGLYRWASTGHWTNYDEAEAGGYTLPDPLLLSTGERVADAQTWFEKRRPEIVGLYETEIFGKVPANAPKVTWEVTRGESGRAMMIKEVLGRIGDGPATAADAPEPPADDRARRGYSDPPRILISLTLPADATGPVPVIFGAASRDNDATLEAILDRGWGYGTVNIRNVQPDSADLETLRTGTIGMTLKPGQPRPADEWGVLRAWAWALSRAMDYLETDPQVDAKRVAFSGHSRYGKMVLLAAAMDERIPMVFATCSGEMGASLSRRDWGETVDDLAQLFAPHFAGNFVKYAGRWNDLPVDAHMLLSLIAPRPVFLTGGTADQWSDPTGEFLAAVAAGPVYRLLGKKDLGATKMPPPDMPLAEGDLAFHEHTGGHVVTPAEWRLFLEFADRYFGAGPPSSASP